MKECSMKLTDAQLKLVESNIGLARSVAWKRLKDYARFGMDWDDVFSVACVGLMRAVRTFNPEKSRASTYLTYGCESELSNEMRKQHARFRSAFITVPIDEVCLRDRYGNELRIADTLVSNMPTPEEVMLMSCSQRQIQHVLKNDFPHREYLILLRYMNGATQRDIAHMFGCSQAHVSRTITRMRKRVKEELAA